MLSEREPSEDEEDELLHEDEVVAGFLSVSVG